MNHARTSTPSAAATAVVVLSLAPPAAGATPSGASDLFDQSEYALGSYTSNVVFVQDDLARDLGRSAHPVAAGGGVVHWTQPDLTERRSRIDRAAAFWNNASAARHHPGAQLNVAVNRVNAGQPLTVPSAEGASNACGDALNLLDPVSSATGGFNTVRAFNAETRTAADTDWSFTTFVKPHIGRAPAFLNGPFTNGFEEDPSYTHARGMGHIFGPATGTGAPARAPAAAT